MSTDPRSSPACEAEDLDEALSFAARIPGMGDRAVEVRPILDFRR